MERSVLIISTSIAYIKYVCVCVCKASYVKYDHIWNASNTHTNNNNNNMNIIIIIIIECMEFYTDSQIWWVHNLIKYLLHTHIFISHFVRLVVSHQPNWLHYICQYAKFMCLRFVWALCFCRWRIKFFHKCTRKIP